MERKTKEEILKEHFKESIPAAFEGKVWDDRLLDAIDEYTNQEKEIEVLAFEEWKFKNGWYLNWQSKFYESVVNTRVCDAQELYKIYKEETAKANT